jgi:UDP-2-acetamido-2,6-beta-L-arabino-hexul-4-ose reductase
VNSCDVIIHLAALNRHVEANVVYQTNIELAQKLILSLDKVDHKIHLIFASSSQEENDSQYGKSKRECRELLAAWARQSGNKFSGFLIPNVFGPFGNPYYNSFIATFCHQLVNNEAPRIDVDSTVNLIYVGELVSLMLNEIRSEKKNSYFQVPYTAQKKVSEVLGLLERYNREYKLNSVIPLITSNFELNLFNTFRSFFNYKTHFPVKFTKHSDQRGDFVELIRLNTGGQVSFSTTLPGVTRGNHYHTRKIERFAVIKGQALIQLRKIGTTETIDLYINGNEPGYVDMPVWYTHNIKNIGNEELVTVFWINEMFNSDDPDTYFEIV